MNYAIHILKIKLWNWHDTKDKWDFELSRYGPNEYLIKSINEAELYIAELKKAIEKLEA